MKILIVLPDRKYYLWQMLTQINNLKNFGLENNTIYLIGERNYMPTVDLRNIIKKSNSKATFIIYKDNRKDLTYGPSLIPHMLKIFYEKNNVYNESFFLIDPDVIFTKKIKFNDLLNKEYWYLSNAKSYLNSKYIKNKGEKLFLEMCNIVGIDPTIVEKNDNNAGGAQYLLKEIGSDYWKKVEEDSIRLFKHMKNTEQKYSPENPIQSWTASMWAILWNAWLFNKKTKIIKRFNFTWGSDNISLWGKNAIFHNAGITNDKKNVFNKMTYTIQTPFNKNFKNIDKNNATYNYIKEIKETEKKFSNIIF